MTVNIFALPSIITANSYQPFIAHGCVLTPPVIQLPPENDIFVPRPPGITINELPELEPETQIIDTSPNEIIGCANELPVGIEQEVLNLFFPLREEGNGIINRDNNDIWVYRNGGWQNVGPTPGPQVVVATVVPPWNEIVKSEAKTKTKIRVTLRNYALRLLTSLDITTKAKISARIATPILIDTFATIEQLGLIPGRVGETERIPGPLLSAIIYSQSSVHGPNTAANVINMQDGTVVGTATGTDYYLGEISWIKMDLGAIYMIDRLIIGTATTSLPGDWDKLYTENLDIEYSSDNLNWTTFGTTGTFPEEGIYQLEVSFNCRYIRLSRLSAYVGLTELYALSPRQESPIDFGRRIYAPTSSVQIAAENPIIVANAIFVDITPAVSLGIPVPATNFGYSSKPNNVIMSITANNLIAVGNRVRIDASAYAIAIEIHIPLISTGTSVAAATSSLQMTSSDEVVIETEPWIETQVVSTSVATQLPTILTNPIPGLSPILWYDFSDESTVTVSGSQITTVTGKGSRNWTLNGSSFGPDYVTGINGRKCADWGITLPNGKRLLTTNNTSTTVVESYFVLDSSFGATFSGFPGIFGKGAGAESVTGSAGTTGFYGSGGIATEAYINGSETNNYSSGILPTVNSPAILRLSGGTFTTTSGIVIGNDPQVLGDRGWSGLIGEVIMFSSALSTDNRTKLQFYLALKWGLTLA